MVGVRGVSEEGVVTRGLEEGRVRIMGGFGSLGVEYREVTFAMLAG